MCRAFMKASEDSTTGTNQKGSKFKEAIHNFYCILITKHNNKYGTNFLLRPSDIFLLASR